MDVDQFAGRDNDGLAVESQRQGSGRAAEEVARHRLQAQDLVEDGISFCLACRKIACSQRRLFEHVPGGGADKLACGHHTRRPVDDAFGEDLPVVASLLHQVADDIFLGLRLRAAMAGLTSR